MISNDRLEEVMRLEHQFITFPPSHSECAEMAKELLALRKAFSEPRGYEWVNGDGEVVNLLTHNPKAGDWSEQYWGDRKFRAIPLYRKPE
jgi:hypothetical protein